MVHQKLAYSYLGSPLGPILIAGDVRGLKIISFCEGQDAKQPGDDWLRDDEHFKEVFSQFNAYFASELTVFDLPLHFDGTPFQKKVWTTLCQINYGQTISYGTLASWVGNPKASRAVGAANGANNLPIIVPCHRVIGADNSLIGFTGGLNIKRFFLQLEKANGFQYSLI